MSANQIKFRLECVASAYDGEADVVFLFGFEGSEAIVAIPLYECDRDNQTLDLELAQQAARLASDMSAGACVGIYIDTRDK